MDEKKNEMGESVRRAATNFQRRRDRNKPSTNLLMILKKNREAAGMPLNPIKQRSPEPKEDAESPSGSRRSEIQQDKSKSKPDDRPGSVNLPPTPSTCIHVSPWKLETTPSPTKCDSDQQNWDSEPDGETLRNTEDHRLSHDQVVSEEYWQDNKSVIECNLYMLTNELGCDVTLLVGETQEVINAHSYVLRSRSAVFADILDDQKLLDKKLVTVPDVKPDTFRHLLRYIYTDEIELSVDLASVLVPASSAYGPVSLKTDCFSFLLSEMSSDNVCVTFEHAHKFSEMNAYARCLNFIKVNAVDVLKTPNFKNLCRECLETIIKSDDLNADEFVAFEAAVMWANGECSRQKTQPTDTNRRKVLDELLFHVRFVLMDVLEFTRTISHRDILTKDEKIVLYQFFHGETNKLPTKFNKSKRRDYMINNNLVSKAFGKGQAKIGLPYISSPKFFQVHENNDSLPIKRVIRFQGVNKDWQTKCSDAIDVRVSTPISLRGVQIFGSFTGQESYQVDLKIYDDFKDIVCHDVKTIETDGTAKVYDVILTKSVRVPEGRIFTILVSMRGKSTYHGIQGLQLVEKDGVTFQFFNSNMSSNGTDVTIGQIPTVLFSKLCENM